MSKRKFPPAGDLNLHARAQEIQPLDLSDEAQLGKPAPAPAVDVPPEYVLRASQPFAAMVLRFMANAAMALEIPPKDRQQILETSLAMDAWRERNSRAG